MFIRLLSPHPNAGKEYHERPETARVLIALAQAEQIVDPNAPLASCHVAPPFHKVPTWGVRKNDFSGTVEVIKKYCSETSFYSKPPADCPADVRQRWEQLTSAPTLEQQFCAKEQEKNRVMREMQPKCNW